MRGVLSVIIPTLNAEADLPRCLAALVPGVMCGFVKEAIVADGGSEDETLAIAEAAGCEIVATPAGRARQLIAGAHIARAKWLLFLHPETALADGWVNDCQRFMHEAGRTRAAAFRFSIAEASRSARGLQFWTRLKGDVLKLPAGDQGLLISRVLYDALGGYAELEAMEDVDLVRRIGWRRLTMLDTEAVSSAQKYRRDGYAKRAWRDLGLTTRYLMGEDPKNLKAAD